MDAHLLGGSTTAAKLTDEERVKRRLEADLARLRSDLDEISRYNGEVWEEYRADSYRAISRIEGAIRKLDSDGLPAGFTEKWGAVK